MFCRRKLNSWESIGPAGEFMKFCIMGIGIDSVLEDDGGGSAAVSVSVDDDEPSAALNRLTYSLPDVPRTSSPAPPPPTDPRPRTTPERLPAVHSAEHSRQRRCQRPHPEHEDQPRILEVSAAGQEPVRSRD